MSLVWTLIGGFLYAEIAFILLLILPIVSPYKWKSFFNSRFLSAIKQQAHIWFYLVMGVLVLFSLDALREMRKYSHTEDQQSHEHLNVELQHGMRLFRAQRNFYISGFAIFLVLVIRRLVQLISSQASLMAQSEASMKQAQSASNCARDMLYAEASNLMKGQGRTVEGKEAKEKNSTEIAKLKEQLSDLTAKLERERKDREAIKSQADGLNREYDRLTEEYSRLEKRASILKAGGSSSGRKDD